MKKRAICALSAALAFYSAAAGAESNRETLYFKADSHEMIVTAEEISRNEYNEAAYDIRVTMDGKQTQAINFTSENTNAGEREVYPCDVNMDGYTDLALLNSMAHPTVSLLTMSMIRRRENLFIILNLKGYPSTARSFIPGIAMCSIICMTARRRAFGNCINGSWTARSG